MKLQMTPVQKSKGFTLIEVLIVTAISGMLMVSLSNVVGGALGANEVSKEQNDLNREAAFAMHRIVSLVSHTPTADLWITGSAQYIRIHLDPQRDTNLDGFPDADNDKDGLINEDTASTPGDDDGDGEVDEDWEDKVIIFHDPDNNLLVEQDPFPMDVNYPPGVDQVDQRYYAIASHVTGFSGNLSYPPDGRFNLLNVTLELTGDNGEVVTRSAKIRLGRDL